jgi:hypothetical protein
MWALPAQVRILPSTVTDIVSIAGVAGLSRFFSFVLLDKGFNFVLSMLLNKRTYIFT